MTEPSIRHLDTAASTHDASNEAAVEFRVDGGHVAGFGHLARCLAIWEELGHPATFAVDEPDAHRFVLSAGAHVGRAPHAPITLFDRVQPTPAELVTRFQASGKRVVLLDDVGTGRRLADLVIDPPSGDPWPTPTGPSLGGFENVLLRRAIRHARGTPRGRHVLLAIGGSDPAGLTPPLVAALAAARVDVLYALGPGYRGDQPKAGQQLAPDLAWAEALATATVYVGGFGHSLFEAAYLGTPAVSIVAESRHLDDATRFARHGTALVVNMTAALTTERVVTEVTGLLDSPDRLRSMAAAGPMLVDGGGAVRVARAINRLLGP